MNEVAFIVEEDFNGGYTARAIGQSIFTEAETMEALNDNIREAVECHFGENNPSLSKMRKNKLILQVIK
jgi:hypothetical protein